MRRLELFIPNCHGRQKAKEAQLNRWGRQIAAMDATTRRQAHKNALLGRFTAARGGKEDYAPLQPGRRDVVIPRLTRDKINLDCSVTKEICTTQADIEDIQNSNWSKLYGLGEAGLTPTPLVDQALEDIRKEDNTRVTPTQAEKLHPDVLFKTRRYMRPYTQ